MTSDMTTSERRYHLLLSALPALKILRENLVEDELLYKLPGLDRIIREISTETAGPA